VSRNGVENIQKGKVLLSSVFRFLVTFEGFVTTFPKAQTVTQTIATRTNVNDLRSNVFEEDCVAVFPFTFVVAGRAFFDQSSMDVTIPVRRAVFWRLWCVRRHRSFFDGDIQGKSLKGRRSRKCL